MNRRPATRPISCRRADTHPKYMRPLGSMAQRSVNADCLRPRLKSAVKLDKGSGGEPSYRQVDAHKSNRREHTAIRG